MRSLTKAYLFGGSGQGNNYYIKPKFRILPATRLQIPANSNIWLITAAGLCKSAGIEWSVAAESYFKALANKMLKVDYADQEAYDNSILIDLRKNIKRLFTDSDRNSLIGTIEYSRVYQNIKLESLINKIRAVNAVAAIFSLYDRHKNKNIDCFITLAPRATVYVAGGDTKEYNHLPNKIGAIVYFRLREDIFGLKSSVWLIHDPMLNLEHSITVDDYDGYICSVCKSAEKCPAIDYVKQLIKNGLPPADYELPFQYWDSKLIAKIKPKYSYGRIQEDIISDKDIQKARSNLPDANVLGDIKQKTESDLWSVLAKASPIVMENEWKAIESNYGAVFTKKLSKILRDYDANKSNSLDRIAATKDFWEDLLDLYGGRDHLNKQVKLLLDYSSIYIALPLRVLADILEKGITYKSMVSAPELANQESGTLQERQEAEQYLFNVDPDKPEQAPKYGFFATKDYLLPKNIFRYGQVIIELKDLVKERAGISCGDTIDLRNNLSDPVVPCTKIDIDLFKRILIDSGDINYLSLLSILKALDYIKSPEEGGSYGIDSYKIYSRMRLYYYEAHIFGDITKDDIIAVYAGLKSDAKAITAILKRAKLNIPIKKYRIESALSMPESTNIESDDLIIKRQMSNSVPNMIAFDDDVDVPLRERNR